MDALFIFKLYDFFFLMTVIIMLCISKKLNSNYIKLNSLIMIIINRKKNMVYNTKTERRLNIR